MAVLQGPRGKDTQIWTTVFLDEVIIAAVPFMSEWKMNDGG